MIKVITEEIVGGNLGTRTHIQFSRLDEVSKAISLDIEKRAECILYDNDCCGSCDDIKVFHKMLEEDYEIIDMCKTQHGTIVVRFESGTRR